MCGVLEKNGEIMKPNITHKRLMELLDYDSLTGVFTWKISRSGRGKVGHIAGCTDNAGYTRVAVDGKLYYAHRLVWLCIYGYFPEHNIDHINRNKSDNRIENLRHVTQQCNIRNTGGRRNGTSPVKGVRPVGIKIKKWSAHIGLNGKDHPLGRYLNFDNAVCARLAGEQCLGWSGCDFSSPALEYVQKHINKSAT